LFNGEPFTSVSPADSLGSSVHQKAASLQNSAGHCYSGPVLSGRLRIEELKTNSHMIEWSDYSYVTCVENKTNSNINVFFM